MLTFKLNDQEESPVPETGRLLIVEDETVFLKLLRMILEDEGYEVYSAENGQDGVSIAQQVKPDLIIMDINMPVMNGFQAADILHRDDDLKDVPILFLSAQQDISSKAKGFELGAVDYIVKPFDPTELVTRIRSRLSFKQRNRNAEAKARVDTLSQLIVTIAHHLNNSVSIINGSMDLLNEMPASQEDMDEATQKIKRECNKISCVIESLKDMANTEEIKTMDYLGAKDAMLDISKMIEARLNDMDIDLLNQKKQQSQ